MQTTHFRCPQHGDFLSNTGQPCCSQGAQPPGQPLDVGWEPELRNRVHAEAAEAGWLCIELHDVDVFHFAKPTVPLQGPIVVRWYNGAPVRIVMDQMEETPTNPSQFISGMSYAFNMLLAEEAGVTIIDGGGQPRPEHLEVRRPPDRHSEAEHQAETARHTTEHREQVRHLYPPAFEAGTSLEGLLGWAEGLAPEGRDNDG